VRSSVPRCCSPHASGSPWIVLIPAIDTALIVALAIAGTHRRLAEYR
jgi:hypothetical protein